ncbi:hypothetical protein OHR68_15015 [Spirillospora sp. NBC_00431]
MSRLTDWVLTQIAGKATADAACSTSYICKGGVKYRKICCQSEGCGGWQRIGRC